jgi:hypothetical protein
MRELLDLADRLAAGWPPLPSRTGIPDEVTVTIACRDGGNRLASAALWESDLGKLPSGHPVADLRALVRRLGVSLSASAPGVPYTPEDAGLKWPHVLDKVAASPAR